MINPTNPLVQLVLVAFAVFFGTLISATNRFRIFDTAAIFGTGIGLKDRGMAALRMAVGTAVTNVLPVLYALWVAATLPQPKGSVTWNAFLGVFAVALAIFFFNRLWAFLVTCPGISLAMYPKGELEKILDAGYSQAPGNYIGHLVGGVIYYGGLVLVGRWLLSMSA